MLKMFYQNSIKYNPYVRQLYDEIISRSQSYDT